MTNPIGVSHMTEANTLPASLEEVDEALANLDTATAAHFRNIQATLKARAQQGAEKWEAISASLIEQMGEQKFSQFFKDVKPAFIPGNDQQPPHLRLAFKTRFLRDWVENNYGSYISAFWQQMETSGTLEFAIQPAEDTPPPRRDKLPAKAGKVIPFPVFPTETRPVVNKIARSALFAAIQGKDRQLVKDVLVAASGDTRVLLAGEQLNQDDHDVLMQLIAYARDTPPEEYIPLPVHSLLKDLGRGTSGKEHKQADAEIKRLRKTAIEIQTPEYTYIGNLIKDAVKHEKSGTWVYKLDEKLRPLYEGNNYTLIDWEGRKKLKGKELARWLQLYYATHAEPFPVKVETLWRLSGSKAKSLFHFRAALRRALDALKANGDIAGWSIDARDRVNVDRADAISASQRRSLDAPQPR